MANSRKSSLTDLAGRIEAVLPSGSSILVGLSGGVDSVVLLHLLHGFAPRYSWKLAALHVHHGISQHADDWAKFCSDSCARLGIPFCVRKIDISPLRSHGLEAAARQLRHAAFAEYPCDYVALAHHRDDQVETLLLQLLRGAGVRGASAMPVQSQSEGPVLSQSKRPGISADSAKIVRPLLHCTRVEIVEYARAHELQWIEDESNADEGYPRNFLRHRLLPLLAEKFPAYRATLSRSAEHFAEAGELLDELAGIDGAHAISGSTLSVAALQGLSVARAKNLLRYFLHQMKAPMPQAVRLDEMLHQLLTARDDADVRIDFGGWQMRLFRKRAYALRMQAEFDPDFVLPWQGETQLGWPATDTVVNFLQSTGQGVNLAKLGRAPVTLRLRRGGETLRPGSKFSTRSLKNLFQEHGIPPWNRDRLPLLYCGEVLVCVPGIAIAAEYLCKEDEAGMRVEMGC